MPQIRSIDVYLHVDLEGQPCGAAGTPARVVAEDNAAWQAFFNGSKYVFYIRIYIYIHIDYTVLFTYLEPLKCQGPGLACSANIAIRPC